MSGRFASQAVHLDWDSIQGAPHIDQWFGVWAMEPQSFASLLNVVQQTDLARHLDLMACQDARQDAAMAAGDGSRNFWYRRDSSGVAVVNVSGTLQKHRQSMSRATSTVILRREIRSAAVDPDIGAILLHVDSPGGTASGTQELANDIAAVDKPVLVHVDDLGASAAYWIASAGDSIAVNKMGMVGSIGTYAVVQDLSARAAQEGIKVHVLRTGKFKGDTVPGMEISAETLADIQSIVDARNEVFLEDVSHGRKIAMERLREIADGRVYMAGQALEMKLVDKVQSFDDSFRDALEESRRFLARGATVRRKGSSMSASPKEIRAACAGCSNDFVVECIDAERDLDAVQTAWVQEQGLQLAAAVEQAEQLQQENTELKAENERLKAKQAEDPGGKPKKRGVEALRDEGSESTAESENAGGDYMATTKRIATERKISIAEAKAIVNAEFPELRAAYVAAVNRQSQ